MSLNSNSITGLPPELATIIASQVPPDEAIKAAYVIDPSGTWDDRTFKKLSDDNFENIAKPKNISWKQHFINCESNLYLRIRNAAIRGFNYSHTLTNMIISSSVSTGMAYCFDFAKHVSKSWMGIDFYNFWNGYATTVGASLIFGGLSPYGIIIGGLSGAFTGYGTFASYASQSDGVLALASRVALGAAGAVVSGIPSAIYSVIIGAVASACVGSGISVAMGSGILSSVVAETLAPFLPSFVNKVTAPILGAVAGLVTSKMNLTDRFFNPVKDFVGNIGAKVFGFTRRILG
jgi:hypothetical protein